MDSSAPIGILDSGVGGLTVMKEIITFLPHENILYLGDTARVPYGNRGKEVITEFALEMTRYLLEKGAKMIIVACNTISATCLEEIISLSPVPVIGVIDPTVETIGSLSNNKQVGVIGTRATISSNIYSRKIRKINPEASVISKACPLFVPFIEEGLVQHTAVKLMAEEYCRVFQQSSIDTLVLGCTHYPLLTPVLKEVMGQGVMIIDSAKPTAREVVNVLTKNKMLNKVYKTERTLYFTDVTEKEYQFAERILGEEKTYSLSLVHLT